MPVDPLITENALFLLLKYNRHIAPDLNTAYLAYADAFVLDPVSIDIPFVSGNPAVGETLSCTMGTWENEPLLYAYEWQRDGVAIPDAVEAKYVVGEADRGHVLTCVVTAGNEGGKATAPPSNPIDIPE